MFVYQHVSGVCVCVCVCVLCVCLWWKGIQYSGKFGGGREFILVYDFLKSSIPLS